MDMDRKHFLFPLAAAINYFSITALLIFSGLTGNLELAADIGVIQGAIIAVFLSLSGNARNLILANTIKNIHNNLLAFRLLAVIPAVFVVFFLIKSVIDISPYLIIGLVIRKTSEWFLELKLASREVEDDFNYARRYLYLNVSGFLLLLFVLFFSWMDIFYITLYLWAALPIVVLSPNMTWKNTLKLFKVSSTGLIPHLGSSTVIAIAVYISRILILIFAGKYLAGQMFTAYAIGGVITALYTYALGPTLITGNLVSSDKALIYAISFCISMGMLVTFTAIFDVVNIVTPLFLYGIGFSLIGGGVMLQAQRQRLYIIQIYKKDVFVPDALINILLVASIPFAYSVIGEFSFSLFYLWSAVLNFLFYMPLMYRTKHEYS